MLSPRALAILIRYLDAVDAAVSKRLLRTPPWKEESLTQLFCEAIDEDAQSDVTLSYNLAEMRAYLERTDEPLSIDWSIRTNQFTSYQERHATQADLGLIIEYADQFEPEDSFEICWLLQAKRVFPSDRDSVPPVYDGRSEFASYDEAQHARMVRLEEALGGDAIRYLLYCPRPRDLPGDVRALLAHARNKALRGHIFDHALGLQLRDDLLSDSPTTAAGMFVSRVDPFPSNLLDAHRATFTSTKPFSWFVAEHFDGRQRVQYDALPGLRPPPFFPQHEAMKQMVRGDRSGLDRLGLDFDVRPLLPAKTVTVRATHGPDLPSRNRR